MDSPSRSLHPQGQPASHFSRSFTATQARSGLHIGTLALTTNDLRLQGVAACALSIIVMTILPLIEFYLVFKQDERLYIIPFLTWGIVAVTGVLGIVGLVMVKSMLLGLHAALTTALGAALGVFSCLMYLMLQDKCDRVQLSFAGCSTCKCALSSTCTREQLQATDCSDCKAWGTDLCDDMTKKSAMLPYVGAVGLLVICAPAVWSLCVLARLESEKSNVSNRLQFARNVLSHERVLLEDGKPGLTDVEQVKELLRTMLAYGREDDRALAARVCTLLELDQNMLMGRPTTADSQVMQAGQQVLNYAIRAASMKAARVGQVVPVMDDPLPQKQATQGPLSLRLPGGDSAPLKTEYGAGSRANTGFGEEGAVRTSASLVLAVEEMAQAAPVAEGSAGADGVVKKHRKHRKSAAAQQPGDASPTGGYDLDGGGVPGSYDGQVGYGEPVPGGEPPPIKKKKKSSTGPEMQPGYEGQQEVGWVPVQEKAIASGDGTGVVKKKKRSKKAVAVAEGLELEHFNSSSDSSS